MGPSFQLAINSFQAMFPSKYGVFRKTSWTLDLRDISIKIRNFPSEAYIWNFSPQNGDYFVCSSKDWIILTIGEILYHFSWWRHQMGAFSAWLVLCAENSPVTGELPSQSASNAGFDVSLMWVRMSFKETIEWPVIWDYMTFMWRHRNVTHKNWYQAGSPVLLYSFTKPRAAHAIVDITFHHCVPHAGYQRCSDHWGVSLQYR